MTPIHTPSPCAYDRLFASLSGLSILMLWLVMAIVLAPAARASEAPLAGTTPMRDLAPLIEPLLRAAGAPDDLYIDFSNPTFAVPNTVSLAPDHISAVRWSATTGRFVIRTQTGAGPYGPALTITGTAHKPVRVPVPRRDLPRGSIIGPDDIEWQMVPRGGAGHTPLTEDLVIGLEARRLLVTGRALRATDLAKTVLVKRGTLVTMIYRNGPLTLRNRGKALESGGMGDAISLQNLSSDRTMTGVIAGRDRVEIIVTTGPHILAAHSGR
ncbi:MAG: flagellar basal body P-ring formation chaperone FlgA [Pseudomonadota bacterium]